jgi:hypothetical protein
VECGGDIVKSESRNVLLIGLAAIMAYAFIYTRGPSVDDLFLADMNRQQCTIVDFWPARHTWVYESGEMQRHDIPETQIFECPQGQRFMRVVPQ